MTGGLASGGGHPWLRPGRRAAVLEAVREQHAGAARQDDGALRVPVDVEALAEAAGLRVIRVSGLAGQRTGNHDGTPLSGLMDFGRGRIYVEARNAQQRQRFTVAHELGHCVLGHGALLGDVHADAKVELGAVGLDPTLDALELVEREAHRFAGLLLIPPDELDACIAADGVDVLGLARRFDVSAPAMRVHLSRYLHPALKRERYG